MTPKKSDSTPDDELPIKLDSTSNGEYLPVPLSPELRWVRKEARRRADANARRLGLSRREFFRSSAGAATVLLTLNEVACGGTYRVPKEGALDSAAADGALAGDEFIFDVQTHHVDLTRPWWKDPRPNMSSFLLTTPKAKCSPEPLHCFDQDHFLKEVFLDSDTDMAVLSALWGTPEMNAILPEEAVLTRERFERMEGAPRLVLHGVVWGKAQSDAQRAEHMKKLVEVHGIRAFKLYPVWSPDGAGYRLDDPKTGMRIFEQGLAAGVSVFAIHKGLKLPGGDKAFTSALDVGPAAKAFPKATLLIYHSGFDTAHKEGPYDPKAELGVDALLRSLEENGIGREGNVYAELGGVWRESMKDPEQAAHVLGKLLTHLGEDRILWGTDAIWYGSPQDQIQAFRAFEISSEFQQRYGYPALTGAIKRKIFGLNAARVYGVSPEEITRAQRFDPVSQARSEYRNAPSPSFRTYGPRTPGELQALLQSQR